MAREVASARTGYGLAALSAAGAIVFASSVVAAESAPAQPALSKDCQAPGLAVDKGPQLAHIAAAVEARRKIVILAIGASSSGGPGASRGGFHALLAQGLEKALKDVEVEIVSRGVSGELADQATERMKVEVALTRPDLVLWELGTFDALAQVPLETFETTVTETIDWLKSHNIDVVLVGLHYSRQMAKDPSYQAYRKTVKRIALRENILRIGRYEEIESIARAQADESGETPSEFSLTEAGYTCTAQYIARAITTSLRATPKPPPNDPN
jgi:acyl-CoA thioesterase-1